MSRLATNPTLDLHLSDAFWFVGATDPETFRKAAAAKKLNEIPSNHSPKFTPVLDPTLRTGLEVMLCAAGA